MKRNTCLDYVVLLLVVLIVWLVSIFTGDKGLDRDFGDKDLDRDFDEEW